MTDSHHPTDTATADALESVTSTEQSIAQHEDAPTEQPEAAGDPAEADSAEAEPTDAASTESGQAAGDPADAEPTDSASSEAVAGESDEDESDSAPDDDAEVARDGSADRVGSASNRSEPAVSAADDSAADSGDADVVRDSSAADSGDANVARDDSAGQAGSDSGDRAESDADAVRDDSAEPAVSAADDSAADSGDADVVRDGSAGQVDSDSGDRAAGESGAGSVRDDGAEPAVSAADGSAAHSGDGVAGGFDNVDPDAVLGDEVSDEVASGSDGDGLPSAVGGGASSGSSAGVGGVAEELLLGLEGVPAAGEVVIDDVGMRQALEAILMVTDEPLPAMVLARAVGRPVSDVGEALTGLAEEYTEQGRGFDLREVGGGWRYYTRPEQAQFVEKFVLDGQQARLTQAALETLAVVAYKQPVSRARVSAIRGVNVDGVMRTLISRGLVEDAGADTESQATLYRTSTYFLERMGMQSLDDLPELAPYLPEMDDVEEELAAQNAPTADDLGAKGSTTPEAGTPVGGTAEAGTPVGGTAEAGTPEAGTAVGGLPDGMTPPAVGTPEPAEAVTSDVGAAGIDGDLSIGDTPELDLEHDEEELAPAEELEAGGSTDLEQEEADPAEIPEAHTGDDGATENDSDAADAADSDAADSDAADTGGDEIRGGFHPLQGSESCPERTMSGLRTGGDLADADTSHDDDILEDEDDILEDDDSDDVDDENERLQAAEELTGETEDDNRLQAAEELTGETEDNRLGAAEELTGETEDNRLQAAEELTGETEDNRLGAAEELTDAAGDVPAEGDAGTADEPGPGDAQYRIGSDD